jgi:cyanophycin synthetase
VASSFFDTILIREDANPRGRQRGTTADIIREGIEAGVRDGARCRAIETVLDELDATRQALDMGRDGDLVVLCVDHANLAWKELQHRRHGTPAGDTEANEDPGAGTSADVDDEEEPYA